MDDDANSFSSKLGIFEIEEDSDPDEVLKAPFMKILILL